MSTYYVNEAMLGDDGTEADARLMVELLTDMGQDVAYGYPTYQGKQADTFLNATPAGVAAYLDAGYWQDALDILAEINAPPTVPLPADVESALRTMLLKWWELFGQTPTYTTVSDWLEKVTKAA